MKNKICIYAICKNEIKFVDRWVKSMQEADYIVVLDTGSTDGTFEKLKEYKNVIVEQKIITPWRFDTARNESLKLIPDDANILFCTDLDEVLEKGWAEPLRNEWIEGVHQRCWYKYSWSHLENGNSGRVFYYDKIHSRNWYWKFPIHETLTKNNSIDCPDGQELNLFNKIHLHHYPDKGKIRTSYLPLLELRAKENSDDYNGLIYLSHEYYYRNYYDKSIETLNYILENFKDSLNNVTLASCYLFMGDDYYVLSNIIESKKCYIDAIQIDNTYREPYINLIKILLDEKNYETAIGYGKECLKKSFRHYSWLERDTSWTYELYDLMSLAYYYAGYKDESLVYAIKAQSYLPNDERLSNNVKIIMENM